MRLVTNPGTNLSPNVVAEHGIAVLPQHIIVDDVHHDTRAGVDLATIDAWVRDARVHPYVLGTSAAQTAGHLSRLGAEDPELLVVTASRTLIQSYAGCVSAAKTLQRYPKWAHLKIRAVDSGSADVATGMATLYAARASAAGFGLEQVALMTEKFAAATQAAFVVQELDYLVKGGRASFLKAWTAKFLGIRPILGLSEGVIAPVGRFRASSDPTEALFNWTLKSLGASAGHRLSIGVSHGGCPELAVSLADKLGRELNVRERLVRPLAAGVYLHGGPGCIIVAFTDLNQLDWVP
ncbi:MAG: DegV family protein [Nannocystales bacterium]